MIHQLKDFCIEILEKYVQPGEHQLVAIMTFGLGDIFCQPPLSDLNRARMYYEQSLEASTRPGVLYKTNFGAYNGLGKVCMFSGKYDEALQFFDSAMASTAETPVLPQSTAHVHNNRGTVFLMTGKLDQAVVEAKKALEFAGGERVEYNEKQRALSLLASVARQQGDLKQALQYLQQVLEVAQLIGNQPARMVMSILF